MHQRASRRRRNLERPRCSHGESTASEQESWCKAHGREGREEHGEDTHFLRDQLRGCDELPSLVCSVELSQSGSHRHRALELGALS